MFHLELCLLDDILEVFPSCASEHSNFITQNTCAYQDILRQLPCSGIRHEGYPIHWLMWLHTLNTNQTDHFRDFSSLICQHLLCNLPTVHSNEYQGHWYWYWYWYWFIHVHMIYSGHRKGPWDIERVKNLCICYKL